MSKIKGSINLFLMATSREKYPEKCPWDRGPDQHLADKDEWIIRMGIESISFSKNKLDQNYFHIKKGDHEEQLLAFKARLLYQKLLDKGFRLQD